MIQKTLNLSLNYKILFDDIKSLSFCDEVRDKSDDFLSSDNHCLILKGDELVNSYIFQAIYNDLEKNSKCIFISMKDNKSEVLKDLDNFSHIFIDSFNECFENKISEIEILSDTKKFEEHIGNNIQEVLSLLEGKKILGEITIVIKGINRTKQSHEFDEIELKHELKELIKAGLSLSAASKYLAKKKNLKKNLIYSMN